MSQNHTSGITSLSHSFLLQWTLKAIQKKELLKTSPIAPVIRSDLYQIKTIKDLRFYLEIERKQDFESVITIKGSKSWSFKVVRAIIATKERAYNLKAASYLSFLNSFLHKFVSEDDDMTIHCVVKAWPVLPAPSAKADDELLQKRLNTIDIEGIPAFPSPRDYSNKTFIGFMWRGEVPDLTVGMAIKIISETKIHKCEVLKILCVEYLMNNISAHSLKQILKAAMDYRLPFLESTCITQLAYGSYEIKAV